MGPQLVVNVMSYVPVGFSVAGGAVGHVRLSGRDAGGGVHVTAATELDGLALAVDDDEVDGEAEVEDVSEADGEGVALAAASSVIEAGRISHPAPSTTTATPAIAATMV